VTRGWSVSIGGGQHNVVLKIGEWSSKQTVLVDGAPANVIRVGPRRTLFSIDGHSLTLIDCSDGRMPRFDLVVDGRALNGGQPRPDPCLVRRMVTGLVLVAMQFVWAGAFLWFGGLRDLRVAIDGQTSQGTVVGVTTKGRQANLMYEFVAHDGKTRRGEFSIDDRDAGAWRIGAPIEIGYVRDAPDVNRPEPRNRVGMLVMWLTPLGIALLSLGLMPDVWRAFQLRRLLSTPAASTAMVSATVERKKTERNGLITMSYRYVDASGRERRGRSARLYPEEAAAYEVGDHATVVCSLDDMANSRWQGAADPRAIVWRPDPAKAA